MPVALAPDDVVRTHEQGRANEREPLLVIEPLLDFLRASGLDAPDDLTAEPIGDGHSNVTFALSTGVVLRRPPRGPLPPSAHDVLREARLLRALAPTDVRTPKILAVCDDEHVISAPFYVMELVEGEVITDSVPAALDDDAQRRRIADELIDGLVELHGADWERLGLDGFGKPTGYLERQLRRFGGLWDHNRTRDLPEVAQVGSWLAEHLPQSPPATIVHGDYRLGNTIYGPAAPAHLAAILDWEMATIGDPLADLGYLTGTWTNPGESADRLLGLSAVTAQPSFPVRRELAAWYADRSGLALDDLAWYQALALWKLAILLEASYRRFLTGTTSDAFFGELERGVPEIAEHALEAARGGLL